ncbi:MAG TPA: sorbitol-6-phosphate 2-dehydrogenase [Verrucomicrobiales bacterium]|nr:sorbitol-6-phosphate 2-dehydrogenase [Verrucomicrobiales bacterium]|tara:strand:- start:330 stop:1418 length:1089 start_codon:yes stop_codon:yes gene_type:complete
MAADTEEMVNLIAPVLRVRLGKGERYPVVRFVETTNRSAVTLSISESMDEASVIEAVAQALGSGSNVESVKVEGIGAFEIDPVDEKLQGRMAGRIIIVTGAAQGFGLGIAQDLVKEGASVVLADINIGEAEKQAEALRKKHGSNRAKSVSMNVTDPASIRSAISETVKVFGGFDGFISNAGVVKAESVKTQPVKDFDFVTEVNYRGYFLCTQAAAQILALQHKACSDYFSDIIQINSKSGLVGSNRNGAYAGSKFGGIGLTQSFALELIEDGIKVNSICPGNFFDGPLWSDPDNGLFAQYLESGKIPGAKTIDDVKRAYESKVPMGRGCTTPDVMKAIYYLIEQKYETGQALPVSGGQVMLN